MIRQIDDDLYQTICSWWKDRGAQAIPRDILPRRGYVVVEDGRPIIAGFLCKEETANFWMLEWIVSNPSSTKEEIMRCFPELTAHVREAAKASGARFVYTTTNRPRLIEKLTAAGFKIDCDNITQLFMEV